MPEQLIFDLPFRTSLSQGDFFLSEANAMASARLEDVQSWTLGKLVLVGPKGAGKTHLAQVWAEREGAKLVHARDLAAFDVSTVSSPIAVDDADQTPADAENTLFHLHNHLATQGLALLLTARTPPARWTVTLPDLKSRMEATDVTRIESPDDALLAAVLVKLFTDRQLDVAPNVISWLIPRMDRSFDAAQKMVEALDRTALSEGRAVSLKLARSILDKA